MLVAMSRINCKFDFARLKSGIISNKIQIRRNWICFPLLALAMPFCLSSPTLAQQNDRSVLVLEDLTSSAGSNAQVELETELPQATGSTPSFTPPATTQQFLPPSPPASMTADSNAAASFRASTHGTFTAAKANQITETRLAEETLQQASQNQISVQATSATHMQADGGTFASRLPSDAAASSDSGLQVDNSFGSSRAPAGLRPNPASRSTRNRFGDFGEPPASKAASRFAPLASSRSLESTKEATAPPTQPAAKRFASPPVVSASAQQPVGSAVTNNRFSSPAASPSQRFSQPPSSSKAAPTPPSRLTSASSQTRPPTSPPASRAPTQPQANSQSFGSSSGAQAPGRFSSGSEKFASPAASRSLQSNGRQSNSFGTSNSFGDSNSRSTDSSRSRGVASGRTANSGVAASNSERASLPMVAREPSTSSPTSFSSASTSQSNTGSSRLPQQNNGFGRQPSQQPLRGRATNNGNDLRNRSSNSVASLNQRPVSPNQSDGKADRASIKFAQQQLKNIQPTAAGADGTPVRLQELLLEPLTGSQRKQMVVQYWETYYDLAALKIASDYEVWLNSISISGAEQGLLNAAQQMASDERLAAKIQLGKSQSRLLDFMPNPRPNEFAPLPADEPLVEQYVTDYEKYKRVRSLPTSMRGIDPMLASTLKLITQRARTVSTAKDAAERSGRSVRNQQIPLASVIAAGQLWRESQLDMVASTVSYNQAISDFVLTLEPNRSPEQLTAFMLGAPKNGSQSSPTNPQNQSTRSAANQPGWPTTRQSAIPLGLFFITRA